MNTFKRILPVGVVIVVVAVGAFILGESVGKKLGTQSQAAVYDATTTAVADWWPAGDGFCYHKIRNEWTSYWVLGEISHGRCIDIGPKARMDTLDVLIKEGAFQGQEKAK